MEWTVPALMYGMTIPFFLALISIYFYIRFRETFLGLWAISWIVHLGRSILMVWSIRVQRPEFILVLDHVGALGSGLPLILGTCSFLGRKAPLSLIAGFVASFLWYLIARIFGFHFLLQSAPIWLFLGTAHIWIGLVLIRLEARKKIAYSIAGWSFFFWGVQKAGYPLLRTISEIAPWGYFIGGVLFMVLAASLLMVYIEEIKDMLLESEQKYRSLVCNIPDTVWRADRTGRILYNNRDARSGAAPTLKAGEVKNHGNKNKFIDIHPDDIERVKTAWKNFIDNKQLFEVEYRVAMADGGYVWLRDKAIAYGKDGDIYADGITSDITAIKSAEKENEFLIEQLNAKIDQVKALTGLLPICASCKKIRDDQGYWNQIEAFIQQHSDAKFSHGICPECAKKLYPEYHRAITRTRTKRRCS
jgi:PAS domain S-box-containing protein